MNFLINDDTFPDIVSGKRHLILFIAISQHPWIGFISAACVNTYDNAAIKSGICLSQSSRLYYISSYRLRRVSDLDVWFPEVLTDASFF